MLYGRVFKCLRRSIVITYPTRCPPRLLLRLKHTDPKFIFEMNEAFLRYEEENDTFDLTFRYVNESQRVDRQFNFSRKTNSTVSNFLSRIDTNVEKTLSKKKKKKRTETMESNTSDEIKSSLLLDGSPVDGDLLCEDLFKEHAKLTLLIPGSEYLIKRNAPWVSSIALPKCIMAGFPTYPAKFHSVYFNMGESTFTWYKNDITVSKNNWQEVGQGYLYIPDVADIGSHLKLKCLPRNNGDVGPAVEIESTSLVEAGPGHCPFETRHLFTEKKLSLDCFRVVSYNILADLYTDSAYSREVLFPYCPAYALDMDYRKYLIVKELLGYNSDIVCLQEVDGKIFDHDLSPILNTLNYEGVFNRKGGTVSEGLATFYDKRRFERLNFESVIMSEALSLEGFASIWNSISNEKFKERFSQRSTAVQATTLMSIENPTEILVVGNTHLYFHPNADHVRLLQGYYALSYVRRIARETKQKYPDHNVRIILCGDFNSVPDCGIYQLMTEKNVPGDYKDWQSHPDEAVEGVSLSHDLNVASACGTPQYTNYTAEFADCLDYIFFETDGLEVIQVIPMPSNEELAEHTALPSVVCPSDHICLCADLKWTFN